MEDENIVFALMDTTLATSSQIKERIQGGKTLYTNHLIGDE